MQYFTLTLSTDQFGMLATSEITCRLLKVKNSLTLTSINSFFGYPENEKTTFKIVADVQKMMGENTIPFKCVTEALTTLFTLK